ncbi:unnamed protein product [Durusdinium trenchii]|uniref:Uncharacterized protein n=1 Tax=Durusdinium trenchii TaxID=1381693 RepID=A0ABP0P392_9DINO
MNRREGWTGLCAGGSDWVPKGSRREEERPHACNSDGCNRLFDFRQRVQIRAWKVSPCQVSLDSVTLPSSLQTLTFGPAFDPRFLDGITLTSSLHELRCELFHIHVHCWDL